MSSQLPQRGSPAERVAFEALQARLPALFREVFGSRRASRTVVVVPGLSLDADVLATIAGVRHYEERMLGMLMLLRLPNTRVVYVTSEPLAPAVVDYYLGLLQGVPPAHARRRLLLLSAFDASPEPLARKLLLRPRLLQRLREAIGDPASAHLSVFNATADELSLAVALGIPLYACDPALAHWGGKSGSRRAFRAAGVPLSDGAEDLSDLHAAAEAIEALRQRQPGLRRVVLKMNEGFSGEGNALLSLEGLSAGLPALQKALLGRLKPEAKGMSAERYAELYGHAGGIVEAWIEGDGKRSPSVQLRINPLGEVELISTHEQVLGGDSGQVFLGSSFPADPAYACELHRMGRAVAEVLRDAGVLGRMAIDFVSVPQADGGWRHHAIEINLRKGGTTLPLQMLQYLTDGRYCEHSARFLTPLGVERCYQASDNLISPLFRGLLPEDLIDLLVEHQLHFDPTRQKGTVFNLIGALSEHGKLGLVSISENPQEAHAGLERVRALLEQANSG
ncbi:MAG: peptide ligase PGM1-related protein [Aquimonas sp.]|nr:peptide ligase PGM1-related protein [Aquimonas sp.]